MDDISVSSHKGRSCYLLAGAKTIAFYSYKGGLGRSGMLANTALFLAYSGRSVVALDLDLQAPGLHHKLGNELMLEQSLLGQLRGAVNEIVDTLHTGPHPNGVAQIAIQLDLPESVSGSIFLIPAGSAPSPAYWTTLSQLKNSIRASAGNEGIAEALLELQARIFKELAPDFLFVDCSSGVTDLGSLVISVLADIVVCITTISPESIEGTRAVASFLANAPRLASQQPLQLEFLIPWVGPEVDQSEVSMLSEYLGGSVTVLPSDFSARTDERFEDQFNLASDVVHPSQLPAQTRSWIEQRFATNKAMHPTD